MAKTSWVPSTKAAVQLGVSRESLVRRVQRGLLRGRLTADGRWEVDLRDLDRFVAEAAEGKPA